MNENHTSMEERAAEAAPATNTTASVLKSIWKQFSSVITSFLGERFSLLDFAQPENTIGGITDFRSIGYMRMFMTGFTDNLTVRFGALDLVRGEWRRYTNTLDASDNNPSDDNTDLDVLTVNIQENGNRSPIRYVSPPGVVREQLYSNNSVINQNEQA
mgnify:CR=1 FL=1